MSYPSLSAAAALEQRALPHCFLEAQEKRQKVLQRSVILGPLWLLCMEEHEPYLLKEIDRASS